MRQNPTPPQLPSRWFGGGGNGGGDVYGGHDVDHGHDENSTNEIFHKKRILLLLQLDNDDHESHHDHPFKRWRTRRRTVIRTSCHTTTTGFSSTLFPMGPIQTTSMLQLWSVRSISKAMMIVMIMMIMNDAGGIMRIAHLIVCLSDGPRPAQSRLHCHPGR